MNWATIWHRLTTSRYTCALEEEVARLRGENRALVNSLLGTAGVPPLHVDGTPPAVDRKQIPPVRRRSWQQIGRMLEIEEARLAAQPRRSVQIERKFAAPAEETRPAETRGFPSPGAAPGTPHTAKASGKPNGSGL